MLPIRRNPHLSIVTALLAAMLGAGAARAQSSDDYPKETIRIVVGFTPGGAPDITARLVAQKLSEIWHQPVIVENRPGAGSAIAAQYVANANPDGYTLLCVTNAHAVAPAINSHLPYDAIKDFAGITMFSVAPTWILVSPSLGVTSLKDLIARAKAQPGRLNYSSAGIGSFAHFSAELFNNAAGIKAQHIPYKGPPEALNALLSGDVQYYLSPIGAAAGFVRDGQLVALAVTGDERLAEFPNVPTVAESGFPDFHLFTWTGLVAPAATPKPIVAKLNQAVTAILKQPDVKKAWAAIGVAAAPTTPAEFDKVIRDDVAIFTKAAHAANISVN